MDRIGIFAVGAALVIVSALHIVHAPMWLVVVPAALFVAGALRVAFVRDPAGATSAPELSRSSATEF